MYVSCDKKGFVIASSDHPINIIGNETIQTSQKVTVGKKFKTKQIKAIADMKIAMVCNWNLPCGISTYSKFLAEAMKPLVKDFRIFSEIGEPLSPDPEWVERCWERGKSLRNLSVKLKQYDADYIVIQHEYGIFPNACHFLSFLNSIDSMPYAVVLHSVYEHLDKTICTAPIKSIIVHSKEGSDVLKNTGHNNVISVIPHGCFKFKETGELWNIFQTPYPIVQFGFGFHYKGVDRALEAVSILKHTDKKFKNIFYCYLASESPHNTNLHDQYVRWLEDEAKRLDISDNVAIIRGFQDEKIINNYLRTARLAIFPYKNNPDNTVYGSSGAIRIAMANRVPIIASESHLFDDLNGVVPRPNSAQNLAKEIDEVFSNGKYRESIIEKVDNHTIINSWDKTAKEYLKLYQNIVDV